MGARESDAALGSHAGSRRGERGAVTERPEARPAKLAKAGARQAGGRGTGGARWGPTGTCRRAPIRDRPLGCPLRAPRPRRRARTCALQPAMWQPGGGGLGAAADGVPRPLGPDGRGAPGPASEPRSGGLRAQSPDAAEVPQRGTRARGGGVPAPPARSLTSAMAVCAREAAAAPGIPGCGVVRSLATPLPVRRSAGAGPGAGGAWSGRGAGGAQ